MCQPQVELFFNYFNSGLILDVKKPAEAGVRGWVWLVSAAAAHLTVGHLLAPIGQVWRAGG